MVVHGTEDSTTSLGGVLEMVGAVLSIVSYVEVRT